MQHIVAVLAVVVDVVVHLVHRLHDPEVLAGRQAPRLQLGVDLRLARGLGALTAVFGLPGGDAVDEHVQRALRSDLRVFLPQRTGCGVARVGERVLACLHEGFVELPERFDGDEHLSADVDTGRVAGAGQFGGDVGDGADIGGDVLTGVPVAAGGGADEPAMLIGEVDGQSVDLELAQVAGRRAAEPAVHTGGPVVELLTGEGVVEAVHALGVDDLGEQLGVDAAADVLGR